METSDGEAERSALDVRQRANDLGISGIGAARSDSHALGHMGGTFATPTDGLEAIDRMATND